MLKRVASLLLFTFMFSGVAFATNMPQGNGRKTVTTAGSAVALSASDTPFTLLTVCAETDNTGIIAVGTSPVAALATRQGTPLNAGDCDTVVHKGLLSEMKIDTTVNGDGVTYEYYYN